MPKVTVLDSEAVFALGTERSKKHRRAASLAVFDSGRRSPPVVVVVPSTVRVEAGWDRTRPRWAAINRFRIVDHYLGRESTNVAARLRAEHGVSPADAHIGAVAAERTAAGDDVVVVTSDVDDVTTVVAGTGARVVRL